MVVSSSFKMAKPLASDEAQEEQQEKRSPWMLKEKDEFTNDIKEYWLRKRKALVSVLRGYGEWRCASVQAGDRHLGISA